jgi:formylglycine-generating enzyme required for sulfatase activity
VDQLKKLEQAISALEAARGTLPDEQIEATIAALREKQAVLSQGQSGIAAGLIQAHNVVNGVQVNVGVDGGDRDSLRRAYLSHLFAELGKLSLAGIDPKAASDAEKRLDLGAVYTALLTLTPEECDHLKRENCLPREMVRGERRLSALAHLDREARLVLLGDPGSGKSTFVNFVALCMAGGALDRPEANLERLREPLPQDEEERRRDEQEPEPQPWQHGALLPVRVVLRDFAARGLPPAGQPADADTLWAFIETELGEALAEFAPHLKRHLHEEGGLLLLDGLDEVPAAEERRGQIKEAVEDFAAKFPRCRILVTSRTYAYQRQEWRLAGFSEAVLAPFERGQIERFVERWYAHIAGVRNLDPDDAQGRAELLKRAINSSDRLQGLAARPLLLTLMASLHAWRGGSLPEKREELYADTVDLLLDWWESQRVVRDSRGEIELIQPSLAEWLKVDRMKVRSLLNRLAYEVHAVQPGDGAGGLSGTADVEEKQLVTGLLALSQNPDVKPKRLVEYLSQRAGLLVPRGVGIYTFPHRTFQEYLAACHLTGDEYPDKVAGLAKAEPNRWREVTLLAGAKSARGSEFALWALVEELCGGELQPGEEQDEADAWGALLAGQLIVENADPAGVSDRDRRKMERVVSHLVGILEQGRLPAVERAAAGVALAHLGDPRPGVRLRADGVPDIAWCEVPAGEFIMGSEDDRLSLIGKETPQLQIELPTFYVSRYPVTNAQFAAFARAGGYRERRYWTDEGWEWREREGLEEPVDVGKPWNLPNHPVVVVSWYEATAFCRWLDTRLGCEVQLPSETEWEKAARGSDALIYPWGEKPDPDKANYSETGIGTTSAVGCFPEGVSPYGALDMSGNVWEWCRTGWQESYEDYRPDLQVRDRAVVRGGAFFNNEWIVRCAGRVRFTPDSRFNGIGFRVVCGAPIPRDSDASDL